LEAKGETKLRWMLERVSSGNCAKVADVYQLRGTRSQRMIGLAEAWPAVQLALKCVWGKIAGILVTVAQ
jgi:hypothetical protein